MASPEPAIQLKKKNQRPSGTPGGWRAFNAKRREVRAKINAGKAKLEKGIPIRRLFTKQTVGAISTSKRGSGRVIMHNVKRMDDDFDLIWTKPKMVSVATQTDDTTHLWRWPRDLVEEDQLPLQVPNLPNYFLGIDDNKHLQEKARNLNKRRLMMIA